MVKQSLLNTKLGLSSQDVPDFFLRDDEIYQIVSDLQSEQYRENDDQDLPFIQPQGNDERSQIEN